MKRFQHFKGGIYIYLFEALDVDSEETLVIYENLSGMKYARSKEEFFGYVQINGKQIERFKPLDV